jgi:hypothetical protein
MQINDVCHYAPGMLNKIGKEGRTSWDSFSYALQMGHNVWSHISSVQEANRQYDQGVTPNMLVQETFERVYFKDVVDSIFAAPDRATAEAIIEENSKFWMKIIGTRGATGKKTVNSSTNFFANFEEVGTEPEEHHIDDSGLDEATLDNLEAGLGDE